MSIQKAKSCCKTPSGGDAKKIRARAKHQHFKGVGPESGEAPEPKNQKKQRQKNSKKRKKPKEKKIQKKKPGKSQTLAF